MEVNKKTDKDKEKVRESEAHFEGLNSFSELEAQTFKVDLNMMKSDRN